MKILLLNAGSSSLKATLVDAATGDTIVSAKGDWAGQQSVYHFTGQDSQEKQSQVSWHGHAAAVQQVLADLQNVPPLALTSPAELQAVGHRIVHGGEFTSSIRVTTEVRSRIEQLSELAPLHNPPSLAALLAAEAAFPQTPQVATFDTAFHASMPTEATTYPIPQKWSEDWKIRRYGFHGLSHSYCSQRAAELLNQPIDVLRLIVCHLGHGCSACAVESGHSVDTTMGFTPLDGLMMATRSGSIDPAIIPYVEQYHNLSASEIETILNRQSGLVGVSGISGDMREIQTAAREGHPGARLAFAIYTRRIRQTIGAYTATMGGVDAVIFTGGVGENSPEVRRAACDRLECLGLEIDPAANAQALPDTDIATPESLARVLVIAAREELSMYQEVRRVLQTSVSIG